MNVASNQDGAPVDGGLGAFSKIAVVLLGGLVLYALAGFLIVPLFVEREIRELTIPPDHRLSVDKVSFNPFSFRLQVRGLLLTAAESAPHLSAEQITAEVHISSLTKRTWIVKGMTIDAPYVAATGDGQHSPALLLTDLLTWAFADSADAGVRRVNRLVVHAGQLHIARTAPTIAAARPGVELLDIELYVRNEGVETRTPSEYSLTASLNKTSKISSAGRFSLTPAGLEGSLKIPSMDAAMLLSYVEPQSEYDTVSGRTSVDGNITYQQGVAQFRGTLQTTEVAVIQAAGAAPVFATDGMLATAVVISSTPPRFTIGDLRLDNPHLTIERNPDGTLSTPPWLVAAVRGSDQGRRLQRLGFSGGSLVFSERDVSPAVQILATELKAGMTHTEAGIELSIEGRINDSGRGRLTAAYRPHNDDFTTTADLSVSGFDLSAVSPWFQKIFARSITSGHLTLNTSYESTGSQFKAVNDVVVQALDLADDGAGAAAPGLDLAIALLEDESGRIEFTLPLESESAGTAGLPGNALSELVDRLAQAPLAALATTIGAEPNFDRIGFEAGNTAFTAEGNRTLEFLARALHQRPRLGALVIPRYHAGVDRDALARQKVMLHIALATSAGPPGSSARTALALSDPKVISVLDEFAKARLRADTITAIDARFATRDEAYYDAVLQALIDNEKVSNSALERVARFRARAILDALAANGVAAERLVIAEAIETASSTEQNTSRIQLFALPTLNTVHGTESAGGGMKAVPVESRIQLSIM